MYKIIFALISMSMLSGCISTQVRDFTDPEYNTFVSKKMLVVMPNPTFEEIFVEALKDTSAQIEVIKYSDLFFPTRQYTAEDITNTIKASNVDAILMVGTVASGGVQSHVIGYQTNVSFNSNSASAYTYAQKAYSRTTSASAKLLDPKTQNIIWTADLVTEAGGAIYVQGEDTMEDMSSRIIATLTKKQHIACTRKGCVK